MKGYAMLKIGESGWIEKDKSPVCGPMDISVKPLAVAICTSMYIPLWKALSATATT